MQQKIINTVENPNDIIGLILEAKIDRQFILYYWFLREQSHTTHGLKSVQSQLSRWGFSTRGVDSRSIQLHHGWAVPLPANKHEPLTTLWWWSWTRQIQHSWQFSWERDVKQWGVFLVFCFFLLSLPENISFDTLPTAMISTVSAPSNWQRCTAKCKLGKLKYTRDLTVLRKVVATNYPLYR